MVKAENFDQKNVRVWDAYGLEIALLMGLQIATTYEAVTKQLEGVAAFMKAKGVGEVYWRYVEVFNQRGDFRDVTLGWLRPSQSIVAAGGGGNASATS